MTELKGKRVVITGATSGIGAAAALAFAQQGAHVVAVGRDPVRGEAVAQELTRRAGTGEFLAANFLSLSDVARLADEVLARSPTLDVLVNNAGGMFSTKTMSVDHIEATFALNTVAAFLLAHRLQGALIARNGRVVNIVTGFLGRTRLNVDDLVNPPTHSPLGRYARAKLASIMMTVEQAERWQPAGIRAVAVQPGIVLGTRFGGGKASAQPSLLRSVSATMLRLLGIGASMEQAVERYQLAAFGDLASGTYLAWGKVAKLPQQAQDAAVRRALWHLLEQLTHA
jgi:NAD(P)-dependent dehydrogenase (short-subunit alcohol dehydrogenase family)